MIKHIVLFQLKKDLPENEKQDIMKQFKAGIMALPAVIPCIRHIEVGFNTNPDEGWDICLNGDFDSLDDVRSYSANPAHQAVSGAMKPHLSGRSCVDYDC